MKDKYLDVAETMIHVDGRSILVMDSVTDRMRLKDKIVANVAKAIKSIQELQVASGTSTIVLGNYDWQCHRLCEHLDHAFLHGLRHVTPGYWKMVSEFTHKDCVKEIKRMRHVTTDLGRGRAWLFTALNECLLESYIRCYQQNEKLVNQYYVRDALVRDHQRWNLILTLTSGLENAVFQLECDVPYLDLCVYPPDSRRHRAGTLESAMEFDKLSLCSMDSVHVPPSRPLAQAVVRSPDFHRPGSESDSASTGSYDVSSSNHSNHRSSPSVDSGCHSDWNFRQRSITPIDIDKNSSETGNLSRLNSNESLKRSDSTGSGPRSLRKQESVRSYTEIVDTEAGELEIIRLAKPGGSGHKHKKKKKKKPHEPVNPAEIAKFNKDKYSVDIPPIDEVKFEDAVMNSQNNNIEPSLFDYSLSPEVRTPGDGHEIVDKVTNGAVNKKSSNGNAKLTSGKEKEKLQAIGVNRPISPAKGIDILHKKLNSDGPNSPEKSTPNFTANSNDKYENSQKSHKSSEMSKSHSGGFLGIIKTRVSNIVDKGVHVEDKKVCDIVNKTVDKSLDVNNSVQNTHNVQYDNTIDKSGWFKAGLDAVLDETESVDPRLYSGSPIHDEVDTSVQLTEKKNATENNESIFGGPSIYSCDHDTDMCNSDTEDISVNHDIKNDTSTKNHDRDSKASSDMNSVNYAKKKSTLQDIYAVNHDFESSGDTIHENIKAPGSPVHDTTSPEHSPSPYNQKLPSKLTSQSSSVSSSPIIDVRQSSNQKGAYRASPSQKTDSESQRSDDSKSVCSTMSSDVELQGSELELKGRVDDLINKASNKYHHLSFVDALEHEDDIDNIELDGVGDELNRGRSRTLCDGEVELDNNSMLFLMLDVLETDETFIKMFCCRQGHTEGKITVAFLLISTNSLHILSQQEGGKFSREATVPFIDIDYVSLGFNKQVIHLVCKNRRKQHWFTTGEERVTTAIIDWLASSMEKSELKPAKLEIDTDATTQKISLRKYVTKECRCEVSEAAILCYSLVHWEDPSVTTGPCHSNREGNLLYKSSETANMLGTQVWKPAYAVLKDCMLCLYQDKNDPKPQHFLSMGGDQCVGCKRDFNSDRNHSIRVMLADGTYWSFAFASEMDANDWIQALCQAVSEGLMMSPAKTSNIPCCMLLTRQKLLMCHEDMETSFVRTLGSAKLVDITAVLNDELCRSFIVLAFDSTEANVSSEKWVLYFNSQYECERFTKALSECWSTYFQVEVPVIPMEDFALGKKCREMADYLKRQLTLK